MSRSAPPDVDQLAHQWFGHVLRARTKISSLEICEPKLKTLPMTSTVTVKGQTVVPKALRERFALEPGMTLDWRAEGDVIRVVKIPSPSGSGQIAS